jgi:hypothetical protein
VIRFVSGRTHRAGSPLCRCRCVTNQSAVRDPRNCADTGVGFHWSPTSYITANTSK